MKRICFYCGVVNYGPKAKCSHCGNVIDKYHPNYIKPKNPKTNFILCKKCGQFHHKSDKNCINCGELLNTSNFEWGVVKSGTIFLRSWYRIKRLLVRKGNYNKRKLTISVLVGIGLLIYAGINLSEKQKTYKHFIGSPEGKGVILHYLFCLEGIYSQDFIEYLKQVDEPIDKQNLKLNYKIESVLKYAKMEYQSICILRSKVATQSAPK